ncbi:MAG: transketolase family protein [Ignavibacteria bacterium]|jgi:transketolase|nr:transketolase family protein [Ignavibacteria bacterium]MDH7527146.1 transketolase family protein [Ignavibacteria bacterium]
MGKSTRLAFGETIAQLGEVNSNIVVLDADLSKSTMSSLFAKKFPERFFEMGIQEANMIGVSAGLALSGKIAYACSFACFITGRYDTIRISVAYTKANVRIIGTHAGIGIGEDGTTQMGLEDVSLMRSLPNFSVCQPCDEIETRELIQYSVEHNGPMYIRLTRQNVDKIFDDNYKFEFGKGVQLTDGNDAVIFATGALVAEALKASNILKEKGYSLRVVNIHTIKPIDKEIIIKSAKECKLIFTAEDHNIIGGLGSAVAEVLSENYPAKLIRIGLPDVFGESGTPEALYKKYGFDAESLASRIETQLKQS